MKKLWIALCIMALLIGCCVLSAGAASSRTAYCEACKTEVTWEPFVFGTTRTVEVPEGEETVHKHYYFTSDRIYSSKSENFAVYDGATACLDLNGHRWECRGYAFLVEGTLNIMDSVGTAEIIGGNGSGSTTGGVFYVRGGTLNMYGGTYKLNGTYLPKNGGIVALYENSTYKDSIMNMYGGTIVGTRATLSGGAIRLYYNSQLNLYGGRVTRGEAQGTGNDEGGACINAGFANYTSKVRLAGTAQVDEIMLFNKQSLVVDETFTGWANVTFGKAVTDTAAEGLVIGTCSEGYQGTGSVMFDAGDGFQVVNDGTDLKLAAIPENILYRTCDVCGTDVKYPWLPYAPKTEKNLPAGVHHRYLEHTMTETDSESRQLSMSGDDGIVQLCLDLYGNGIEVEGRLASLGKNSVLNVMDTVGGGYAQGATAGTNAAAGVVYVGTTGSAGKATFNLYSGTLKFKQDDSVAKQTGRGGIVAINEGIMNMYGGTVEGADMKVSSQWSDVFDNGSGGAIYVYGHAGQTCELNVYGGQILNGTAAEGKPGPGVFVLNPNAVVTLTGNANVENIYMNSIHNFAVTGTYTGTATITLADALVAENLVIGSAAGADLTGATLTCDNGKGYYVPVEDGKLIISSLPNGTIAINGENAYGSVQDAVNAYEGGVIALCKSVSEDVNVTKSVTIQLGGYELSGNITVAEGATLYAMDELTDDFDVSDGAYGKLTGVTGNVAGAQTESGMNYLAVNEEGAWSFHAVKLEIYAMTLSVDENGIPGLYYKSNFKADQVAAEQISTFGVALSVFGTPDALENEDVRYTAHDHFEAGPNGNLGNNASSLLKGILKETNSNAVNKRNLNIPVYGRAYAKSADGQILFGAGVCRSLAQQLQEVDEMVDTLSENQTAAVVKLYNTFKPVLAGAKLSNIEAAVEAAEEGTLKVLVLGNSHGLDATRMLYEVFHTEAPEQKVVIGALYYSGCRIEQHRDFLENNKPEYEYYKNDGTNADRAWSMKQNVTCLEALQDEQWDIILMQQMNDKAAMDYDVEYDNQWYIAEDWKAVAEYLLNNQDIQPKLGFHMTWANPDSYELYLNADTTFIKGWRKRHETYWSDPTTGLYDQSILYSEIVRCVQTYIADSTEFLGKTYFDGPILASATAVQYAMDVRGLTHDQIYRDYTHLNDYGRLMVAYLWYAQIMELEEITEVNIDAIPEVLRNKSSLYPAAADNYAITEQMKEDLIASVNWSLENPYSLPAEN